MRQVASRTEGCAALRAMSERRDLEQWAAFGVRLVDASPLPDADMDASLVLTDARTFLVYSNYEAILAYNCSHHYALSVAMLADRIR
jgi:membrane-bound lytic murein transglycosylase B